MYSVLSTSECNEIETTNCLTEKFELTFNKDKALNTADYVFKAHWSNGHVSTFKAINMKKDFDFGKISYAEDEVSIFGLESSTESFYTVAGIGSRRVKYSLTSPDRTFVLDVGSSDWRLKQFEAKFLFGLQSDYPTMKVRHQTTVVRAC